MAYAAVTSLKQTIQLILQNSSHISILPSFREIIEPAYLELKSSQYDLLLSDGSERMNTFVEQIREAVYKLEDVIEAHVFLSQTEERLVENSSDPFLFSPDDLIMLKELKQGIDSFTKTVKEMGAARMHDLCNPLLEEEEEEEDFALSRVDFDGNVSKMVGLSDQFAEIKDRVATNLSSAKRMTVALFGMAGIGKTTLAKKLFQDPLVLSYSRRVFVTIGPKCKVKRVLLDILKQVNPDFDEKILKEEEEEDITDCLKSMIFDSLTDQRYFIVLDNLWSCEIWSYLEDSFPKDSEGSQVLLTTRLYEVAIMGRNYYQIRFLDEKESWDLLCDKVFREESCPPELEEPGKKIAEYCDGLPLTIVTVADILSEAEKTAEYWKKVAANKRNSVFVDAYERMLKVLYSSYNYLPEYLKAFFLYMGVFPQNYEISYSKLINLWSAEGFPEPNDQHVTQEYFALQCLHKLVLRSVVLVHKRNHSKNIKTCSLHSSFWYLSNKEAGRNKFFHGLNSPADGSAPGIKSQRRLCIRNNTLFGMKDVFNSMASILTVRSLLCTGPHHQYPVPICWGLRLLRVLDALTIRFYEFPMEVLDLVRLSYLALTFKGKLPASISKLWNLKWLIVSQHLSIKSFRSQCFLPMEIWDMQELKHLRIMGSNLPHPREGCRLPNLLTLLDVSAESCTKDVFERIPNLNRLGIRIELSPDDVNEILCFFDHISHLGKLKTLKCIIVNPKIVHGVVAPPAPLSIISAGLQKLTLSGFGYSWGEMSKISLLPKLRVLKLRCYAFRGPKWEVRYYKFPHLEHLLIEDTDLVDWIVEDDSCFSVLKSLSLKHCYKLGNITAKFRLFLQNIEIVDCNPVAVSCAKKLKKEWDEKYGGRYSLDLNIQSSWNDVKIK